MENSKFIKSFDGTKLYMVKNLVKNPDAIVVIVHGLGEASNRYDYLAESFSNHNFGVYRFDHRGHGRSDGDKGYYKDFNDLIDDINFVVDLAKSENGTLPIFLLGHSMGGFGVGAFGTKYPNKITGIIMSGGLTRDNGHLLSSIPEGLNPHTYISNEMTDMICTDKSVVDAYRSDPLVLKEISAGLYYELTKGIKWLIENKECFKDPVLILHGKDDKLVSCEDSKDFFASISSVDKQIKIYDNLYHEILNEPCRDNIISYISDWIKIHL